MSRQKTPAAALTFDERLRFTVPAASRLLSQSISKTYMDIKAGTLHIIKDGKRSYVPGTEIARKSQLP